MFSSASSSTKGVRCSHAAVSAQSWPSRQRKYIRKQLSVCGEMLTLMSLQSVASGHWWGSQGVSCSLQWLCGRVCNVTHPSFRPKSLSDLEFMCLGMLSGNIGDNICRSSDSPDCPKSSYSLGTGFRNLHILQLKWWLFLCVTFCFYYTQKLLIFNFSLLSLVWCKFV